MPLPPALAFAATRLQTRNRRLGKRCPVLIFPTDSARVVDPVGAVAQLPRLWVRGAPPLAVILRESDDAKRRVLAEALAPLCRARRIRLLVANDAALAARVRADGVHLSESALRRRDVAVCGFRSTRTRVITAAAHSYLALIRAARAGVDGALLSPAFATRSHPDARPLGPVRFASLAHALRRRGISTPIIALGGVSASNARRLANAGADGLAAIGALARQPPP